MNAVSGSVSAAVDAYRAGVRAELSDLPSGEVSEILDDVGSTLDDLRPELGEAATFDDVVARLGTPQAYAAELRAAAGYPPKPVTAAENPSGSRSAQLAVVALVASVALVLLGGLVLPGGIGLWLLAAVVPLLAVPLLFGTGGGPRVPAVVALPVVQRFLALAPDPQTPSGRVAAFAASLQTAWWVLRGLLAAWLLAAVVLGAPGLLEALVPAVVTVPGSIWVGYASRRDRRWLWIVAPLNAFAAIVLGVALSGWGPSLSGWGPSVDVESAPSSYYGSGLHQDGEEITDIRPVDALGTPLDGVYLFDQFGRPVDTYAPSCDEMEHGYPERPGVRPYPRGTVEYDEYGRCREVPPGPLVVAVPTPTTSATPTPSAAPATDGVPAPGVPTAEIPPGVSPPVPTAPAPPTG